jgi:hypothetical protein
MKILASSGFLSAFFPKKLFYQTFLRTAFTDEALLWN